jgi:uncharacterized membrane protein
MNWLNVGVITAATGSGVFGGVLFAFSSFVMPALNRVSAREAITTMQSLNERAPAGLGLLMLGTSLVSAGLAAHAVVVRDDGWQLRVAGAGLFLLSIGITAAYHIPRNNALDALDVSTVDAARAWADYYGGWVRMNHVRSAAAIAGSVAYAASLVR